MKKATVLLPCVNLAPQKGQGYGFDPDCTGFC